MSMNGPQVNIPVGAQNDNIGWNGLTIKEILEKVDLFNITVDDAGEDDIKREKVLVGKQNHGGPGHGSGIHKVNGKRK